MLVAAQMTADSMPRGPRPKNVVPEWALALKMRRLQLGNLTQEDIQIRSGEVISQGTISDLERGKVALDSLNIRRASALARALGWSLLELQHTTGIDLGIAPTPDFPAPLYPIRDEVYMPQGLLDAIEFFGNVPEYAELRDPEIQRQLAAVRGFTGGPQTAGEWLEFYRANRPFLKTDN